MASHRDRFAWPFDGEWQRAETTPWHDRGFFLDGHSVAEGVLRIGYSFTHAATSQ
jgi:hypothetical protein